jgi:hypothetical protein
MSATYKQIYTKSSADDLWFFENQIMQQYSYNSTYIKNATEWITRHFPGFISIEIANSITVEELELRKNELRPDLYYFIFESIVEDPTELSAITVIDYIKKYNTPIILNPYENTHIELIKFDTWENLIAAYTSRVDSDFVIDIKHNLTEYNNTLVEEFYIDDVKQDYPGILGN